MKAVEMAAIQWQQD